MAHTSLGIDVLGLICPDNVPIIFSALPPSLALLQQNSSSSTSRLAMKAAEIREVFTAYNFLTRTQTTIQSVRLASPDIRLDSETRRVTSDNAHTKLAACTVGTLSSMCMIALPPAFAVDVGVVMAHPVAAESSSGSAVSIERILAEQLAARSVSIRPVRYIFPPVEDTCARIQKVPWMVFGATTQILLLDKQKWENEFVYMSKVLVCLHKTIHDA